MERRTALAATQRGAEAAARERTARGAYKAYAGGSTKMEDRLRALGRGVETML